MKVGDHEESINLAVSHIPGYEVYLGYDWLHTHNPQIDWTERTFKFNKCPSTCNMPKKEEHYMRLCSTLMEEGDVINNDEIVINSQTNISIELTAKEEAKKEKKDWTELVPSFYHEYADVFTKEDFDSLPER